MASAVVTVAVDDGEATPLLQGASDDFPRRRESSAIRGGGGGGGEITASVSAEEPDSNDGSTPPVATAPKQRLVSLDVFRRLTVALMILVDDAGKAFPSINRAPWFGVTLADFVMPFFLFGVGVPVTLVFKVLFPIP